LANVDVDDGIQVMVLTGQQADTREGAKAFLDTRPPQSRLSKNEEQRHPTMLGWKRELIKGCRLLGLDESMTFGPRSKTPRSGTMACPTERSSTPFS
jgi:hypothetical protein